MDTTSTWVPLLHGDVATQANKIILGLKDGIVNFNVQSAVGLERAYPNSLGWGRAGIALFYAYASKSDHDPLTAKVAEDLLFTAVQSLAEESHGPDLYSGFAGIGWVFEHVARSMGLCKTSQEACIELDNALLNFCETQGVPCEFVEGLAGICIYAISRCPYSSGRRLLASVLARLDALSLNINSGTAWEVSSRIKNDIYVHYPKLKGSEVPFVKTNLAHGVAGIIGALAAAKESGVEIATSERLLTRSTAWLSAQQQTSHSYPQRFPTMAFHPWFPQPTTGWCNGDIGIALALYNAATAMGDSELAAQALDIALAEAKLKATDIESENQRNYTICHGAAGRAHIFNRLHQSTKNLVLRDAALYWFQHLLNLREEGTGVGGYVVHEPSNGGPKTTAGFLMGAAGLGLVLLAATTRIPPLWDQVILASIGSQGE